MLKTIHDFVAVIDSQTIIVSFLAFISTYFCYRFGFEAEIPTGLIGIAVVFPIVFSINAAYRRREEALRYFSSLKGHAVSLYYAHRDWVPNKDDKESEHTKRCRKLIEKMLTSIDESLNSGGEEVERFEEVYRVFSKFSVSHETLREAGVTGSEVSRANQYLRSMIIEFERMRNIAMYRTPLSLRAYSRVFLNIFPILFGPYFAHLCSENYPSAGYLVALLYSLILVTLDNIQEDLEDPFDGIGVDDIKLNVIKDYSGAINE